MVNLQLVDVISRVHVDLGWMRPSRDVMLLLGHFDQYSHSAQIFSPAGDELALAASIAQEQLNGSEHPSAEMINDGRNKSSCVVIIKV